MDTLINLLGLVIIPVVIFILPILFEAVKTRKFLALIKRELIVMRPKPQKYYLGCKWYQHLDKRFIHEKIFEDKNVSENRDFILSLPPDISYNMAQMWTQFDKATASGYEKDLAEHGAAWCCHLYAICEFLDCGEWLKRHTVYFFPWAISRKVPQDDYTLADRRRYGDFYLSVCEPWMDLIVKYHPGLEKDLEGLPRKKHRQWPKLNESPLETSKSI